MDRPPRGVKLALAAVLGLLPAAAGAAVFSDILPGARPAGMGYAYTAVSDDAWGMFYNPAGLARTPFTMAGFTLGRQLSPEGNLAYHAWSYARPLPILPGSTVGAGYLGLEQADGRGKGNAEKNELVLHFSDAFTFPQYYITRPFNAGANFKIAQVASPGKGNKLGLALDGGVLFEAPSDLRLGLSILDLTTGLGVPAPSVNFGTSWVWDNRVTFAADLRIRPGLTQFFPGVEWSLFQRLLKFRLGKGLPLNGSGQLALGLGADFSPLSLDFTLGIPSAGWNRTGGTYLLSVQWRFGAPEFHGRFVGSAARRAEDLRSEIEELERRRKDAEARAHASEADKESLDGQLRAEEERLRQVQEDSRKLETEVERRRYDVGHPPAEPPKAALVPAPRPAPKPVRKAEPRKTAFPLRHLVAPGDTLRRLADRYYGDPTLWEAIYDANPDKVERGLPIEGTILLVPAPRGR